MIRQPARRQIFKEDCPRITRQMEPVGPRQQWAMDAGDRDAPDPNGESPRFLCRSGLEDDDIYAGSGEGIGRYRAGRTAADDVYVARDHCTDASNAPVMISPARFTCTKIR